MTRRSGDLSMQGHLEEARLGALDVDHALAREIVSTIQEARAHVAALRKIRAANLEALGHTDHAKALLGLNALMGGPTDPGVPA